VSELQVGWYVDDVFVFVGTMVLDTFYSHASNKTLELTAWLVFFIFLFEIASILEVMDGVVI